MVVAGALDRAAQFDVERVGGIEGDGAVEGDGSGAVAGAVAALKDFGAAAGKVAGPADQAEEDNRAAGTDAEEVAVMDQAVVEGDIAVAADDDLAVGQIAGVAVGDGAEERRWCRRRN